MAGALLAGLLLGLAARKGIDRAAIASAGRRGFIEGAASRNSELMALRGRVLVLEHQLRLFPRQGHAANGRGAR
jgi:hypothetical protein